jgi:hypothetical protein
MGVKLVLDGRAEQAGVTKLSPDIELLFQLRTRPQDYDVAEYVASRSQTLDDVPLHVDIGVEPKESRAERGASY